MQKEETTEQQPQEQSLEIVEVKDTTPPVIVGNLDASQLACVLNADKTILR